MNGLVSMDHERQTSDMVTFINLDSLLSLYIEANIRFLVCAPTVNRLLLNWKREPPWLLDIKTLILIQQPKIFSTILNLLQEFEWFVRGLLFTTNTRAFVALASNQLGTIVPISHISLHSCNGSTYKQRDYVLLYCFIHYLLMLNQIIKNVFQSHLAFLFMFSLFKQLIQTTQHDIYIKICL